MTEILVPRAVYLVLCKNGNHDTAHTVKGEVEAEIANNAHLDYGSEVGKEWLLSLVGGLLSTVSERSREKVVDAVKDWLGDRCHDHYVLPPPSNWDYITDSSSPAPVLFAPHSPLQGLLQSYQDLCCDTFEVPGMTKEWAETIVSDHHSLVIPGATPGEAASGMSFMIMYNPSGECILLARILALATRLDQERKGHATRLVTSLKKLAVFMATQISAPAVLHVQSFSTFFSKFGMEPEEDDFGIFTGSVCTEVRGGGMYKELCLSPTATTSSDPTGQEGGDGSQQSSEEGSESDGSLQQQTGAPA